MFTVEHDFDASVITLIDEGARDRQQDVTVKAYDERVVIEQEHPQTGEITAISLSPRQLRELLEALSLPEGAYRLSHSEIM